MVALDPTHGFLACGGPQHGEPAGRFGALPLSPGERYGTVGLSAVRLTTTPNAASYADGQAKAAGQEAETP